MNTTAIEFAVSQIYDFYSNNTNVTVSALPNETGIVNQTVSWYDYLNSTLTTDMGAMLPDNFSLEFDYGFDGIATADYSISYVTWAEGAPYMNVESWTGNFSTLELSSDGLSTTSAMSTLPNSVENNWAGEEFEPGGNGPSCSGSPNGGGPVIDVASTDTQIPPVSIPGGYPNSNGGKLSNVPSGISIPLAMTPWVSLSGGSGGTGGSSGGLMQTGYMAFPSSGSPSYYFWYVGGTNYNGYYSVPYRHAPTPVADDWVNEQVDKVRSLYYWYDFSVYDYTQNKGSGVVAWYTNGTTGGGFYPNYADWIVEAPGGVAAPGNRPTQIASWFPEVKFENAYLETQGQCYVNPTSSSTGITYYGTQGLYSQGYGTLYTLAQSTTNGACNGPPADSTAFYDYPTTTGFMNGWYGYGAVAWLLSNYNYCYV